ncbi:MAG: DUF3857 domain-containing transglutaminase family protein [Calditrichaeota bacterium]|nr:DUF3857 domain-containing transglutaminase family protein [Calditrichota bacterium]
MRNPNCFRFFKLIVIMLFFLLSCYTHANAEGKQNQNLPPGDTPPLTVFDRIESAGNADDYEDIDHLIVYDLSINRMKESGVTEVDGYVLYKILDEKGCRNMSVQIWGYDPQSSFVQIKEVNIIRDDKKIPVDVALIKDLPAPQSAIYWNNRLKILQLPRLKVNDGIEIVSFRKGFTYALLNDDPPPDESYIPPMPGEYFDITLFESSVPIIEKKYVLTVPENKRLHSQVFNGTLFSSTAYTPDSTIYSWWKLDVPARKSERYQPSGTDLMTKVVMSTAESWEAKSRWFFEINKNQFEVTDPIKKKVEQIIKEAGVQRGTEDEKAEALLHWVAQNIRYSGQTMGKGEGFTLHSGVMIFEQRSGVCKDIAGMLVTMMRAAGMDSYAAMTLAGGRIEDLPADQFNHCVTALRKKDGSFVMYDPTWVPFYKDIWSKLESEQHYVVGTPTGEDLSRISYSPPEESPLFVKSIAKIDDYGNLECKIELRCDGAVDSRLRRMASGQKISEIEIYLAGVLRPISERIEGIEWKHGDLYDFENAMWWDISFRVPKYALLIENGFEFQSPMMMLTMHNRLLLRPGDYEWEEERKNDVFLYYTQHLSGIEKIKVPKGLQLAKQVDFKEIDETYAAFSGKCELEGRELTIRQNLELRRRQIPPDGYPGFRDSVNEANKFAETVFRVERGGAK